MRILQVLLVKLCFCGGGCGGRILAVQDGREVHDPTRRSAADRGRRKLEKLPVDRCAVRADGSSFDFIVTNKTIAQFLR